MPAKPIRLVLIDNDGCLIRDEFSMYDLDFVAKMREYSRLAQADQDGVVPRFTFITGRPQPYVECMQKVFEVRIPAIYENGSGLDLGGQSVSELDPAIDDDMLDRLNSARGELRRGIMRDIPSFFQPGKDGSISIIPRSAEHRVKLWEACEEWGRQSSHGLEVIRGIRCVDIVPPRVDKGTGFERLIARLKLNADEVAGIGDSRGDLRFMKLCGWSGAPANAVDDVKSIADYVSPHDAEVGVLDIMERVIDANETILRA
jgi:HAD superfamily hydrolase (TIGR01484 family)